MKDTTFNIIRILIVIGLVVVGLVPRTELPYAPFFDPDSPGYSLPALNYIAGNGFISGQGRALFYPLFIHLVFRFYESFSALTIVQHLLGLVSGVLVYLTTTTIITSKIFFFRLLGHIVGAIAASIYLLSPNALFFEHAIRPETINPLLIILVIYSQVRVFRSFFRGEKKPLLFWIAVTVFLNIGSYIFRPNVGFGILLAPSIGFLLLLSSGITLKRFSLALIVPAIVGFVLLYVPDSRFRGSDGWSKIFLPLALVACHGNLILPIVESDLSRGYYSGASKEQIELLRAALSEETLKYSSVPPTETSYPVLGINPDAMMYRNQNMAKFRKSFQKPEEASRVMFRYFGRLLFERPLSYLKKLKIQLNIVYGSNGYVVPPHTELIILHGYQVSEAPAKTLSIQMGDKLPQVFKDYMADLPKLAIETPTHNNMAYTSTWILPWVDTLQKLAKLHRICIPALPLFLVVFIVLFVFAPSLRFKLRTISLPLSVSISLAIYNFLYFLSVGAIGTLEVGRYIDSQFISVLMFLSSMIVLTSTFVDSFFTIILPRKRVS